MSNNIVKNNIDNIKEQINYKINSSPFLASYNSTTAVVTDIDTFPYPRFYRGVANSAKPIVMEREAGWRPLNNECYYPNRNIVEKPVKYCWQVPCSTTFPCDKLYTSVQPDTCIIMPP